MPTPDGPFFALDTAETRTMLDAGSILLVDVREPHEFSAGHIPGSVNLPLSRFEVSELPTQAGRRIVLSCAAGIRSKRALEMAAAAGSAVDTHYSGGFKGWLTAGLPVAEGD